MPKSGIFPSREADKDAYFKSATTYLIKNAERLKVLPDALTYLKADLDNWIDWYSQAKDINTSTKLIVVNKNAAMDKVMYALRSIFGDIPQSALTADDRTMLNLEERSTSKTPVPVPHTFSLGHVNTNNRLEHTISFTDEDGRHGKPEGVRGCQIWSKEGTPALNEKELLFLHTVTASPYLNKFSIADAGKTIHYWLRWENNRGETGPWGPVISGTVAG